MQERLVNEKYVQFCYRAFAVILGDGSCAPGAILTAVVTAARSEGGGGI